MLGLNFDFFIMNYVLANKKGYRLGLHKNVDIIEGRQRLKIVKSFGSNSLFPSVKISLKIKKPKTWRHNPQNMSDVTGMFKEKPETST